MVASSSSSSSSSSYLHITLILVFSSLCVLQYCCLVEAVRPKQTKKLTIPARKLDEDHTPEQVHISTVDLDKMRILWVTRVDTPSTVDYGTKQGEYPFSETGTSYRYKSFWYKSDQIHEGVIGPLQSGTVYYYRIGDRELSFRTPPGELPIKFAVVGDLGQTEETKRTLAHIEGSGYDMLLLPGDLAYSEGNQSRWDSFGEIVEPQASKRPWMTTTGEQDVDKLFLVQRRSFIGYNKRWRMPYEPSGSTSNQYYSFDVAGGAVHVVMLGSHTDFGPDSDQYKWLKFDLDKNRSPLNWLIAVVHEPWYTSYWHHINDGEDMRKSMEQLLHDFKVDIIFSAHVNAYERTARIFNEKIDKCGPVHITSGGGGNFHALEIETIRLYKPKWSLFRDSSYGYGSLEVVNETHAFWSSHRNEDQIATVADSVWIDRWESC